MGKSLAFLSTGLAVAAFACGGSNEGGEGGASTSSSATGGAGPGGSSSSSTGGKPQPSRCPADQQNQHTYKPPTPKLPAGLIPANVDCSTGGGRKALPVGTWTALGPPGVEDASYGAMGVTLDPSDSAVIYVTVQDSGIWKSCDAASTWIQLGSPGADPDPWDDLTNYLDVPFEVAVDPHDSKHLYATVGVRGGGTMGFWISTDGGAIWQRTPGFGAIGMERNFDTTDFSVDPCDFDHVILAEHTLWDGFQGAGILETKDGGESWVAHDPEPTWPSGTNGIEFLYDPENGVGDASTWLNMTSGDGFWRTTDAGAHWTKVAPFVSIHGLGVLYRAKNGVLYAGAYHTPVRSDDNGVTWKQDMTGLADAYYYVVWGDGTNLFTARSLNAPNPTPFFTSPEKDGKTWTQWGAGGSDQAFSDGPIVMKYDEVNHILYSVNWKAGLVALKTAP